jgi:hypothetical protein
MRSRLERLDTDTLFGPLQMYETAPEDLIATGDRYVAGLIVRFERHRAEMVATLARWRIARPREPCAAFTPRPSPQSLNLDAPSSRSLPALPGVTLVDASAGRVSGNSALRAGSRARLGRTVVLTCRSRASGAAPLSARLQEDARGA